MRLHTDQLRVEKSGNIVEQSFTIKATAKAFSILSSGLYSDKILAIVRELSCNAWDAHVAAKNVSKQFEIKLPTSFDPTFYVKDFGTGMSDMEIRGGWGRVGPNHPRPEISFIDSKWDAAEAAKHGYEAKPGLYNSYFDSSKVDSDDFIGALGLGSKSPFSYVSSFSVESRIDGTKRLYSAFVGDRGVPAIALTGTEKTSEPNGMTISLATKQGDADKFRTAAQKALMYFEPRAKVTGGGNNFAPYEVKHSVKGTNWRVRQADYDSHMNDAYVVQGFVPYPIDREILQQNGLPNLGYSILGLNIDFSVPIGAVEVAASREALSYTKKSISNLIAAVGIAAAEMRASIQQEFDACSTVWEARLKYTEFSDRESKMHDIFEELDRAKSFTHKNVKLSDEIVLDLKSVKSTQIGTSYLAGYSSKPKATSASRWDPSSVAKSYTVHLRVGLTVLVDDTYNSTGILSQYLTAQKAANPNRKGRDTYVVVLKGVSKNAYTQTEVDAILKLLGNPPYVYASSLPYTKAKTTGTYRARKMDEVVSWQGYPENGGYQRDKLRRVYSRLCWKGKKINPADTDDRFFVELERFTIIDGSKPVEYFDVYIKAMQNVGILSTGKIEIVGLNEKQVVRVKSSKHWINLFRFCEQKFAELNKTNVLTSAVVSNQAHYSIGSGISRHIVKEWDSIRPKIVDGDFKTTLDQISAVYENSKGAKFSVEAINGAANRADAAFEKTAKSQANVLVALFGKTMNKHSMLRLVDWDKVDSKDVNMIIEYVNFVAKS